MTIYMRPVRHREYLSISGKDESAAADFHRIENPEGFRRLGKSELLYHAMDRIKYYYEEERDVSCITVQSPFHVHPPVRRRSLPQLIPSSLSLCRLFPMPPTPATATNTVSFHGSYARALKPKSRKFGPFPATLPSTTPQGMHFSYPRDITASRSVRCINRSGKEG